MVFEYVKKFQAEGGFPVEVIYREGDPSLLIRSIADHIVGGDRDCGYRSEPDWKLEIPVYGDGWEAAEAEAIRRYKNALFWQKRQDEIVVHMEKKAGSDKLFFLLLAANKYVSVNYINTDEENRTLIRQLQIAGYDTEAGMKAEEMFLTSLMSGKFELAVQLAAEFEFSMPENWQDEWFDDLMALFVAQGCEPESEDTIQKLLELNEAKTRELLPGIAIEISYGRLESLPFIEFLTEKGIFDAKRRHTWAKRVLANFLFRWINATLEGAKKAQSSWEEKEIKCSQKKAITTWQLMGEWCLQEALEVEDVQQAVTEYLGRHSNSPQELQLLQRAFNLAQGVVDREISKYLARNIKQDIFECYAEYVSEALLLAMKNPQSELLKEWVPLSFEDKQKVARALIQKIKKEKYDKWTIERILGWNRKFQLHIPELDRLEEVIRLANSQVEEKKPEKAIALRGCLINRDASEGFLRVLCLLSDRGPSPEIRVKAEFARVWLEYEVGKFPPKPRKIDLWEAFASALDPKRREDIKVGPDEIKAVQKWLELEPEAAKNPQVRMLVSGLDFAINNYFPHSPVASKALEFKEN